MKVYPCNINETIAVMEDDLKKMQVGYSDGMGNLVYSGLFASNWVARINNLRTVMGEQEYASWNMATGMGVPHKRLNITDREIEEIYRRGGPLMTIVDFARVLMTRIK